jgi:hypothetical protein
MDRAPLMLNGYENRDFSFQSREGKREELAVLQGNAGRWRKGR